MSIGHKYGLSKIKINSDFDVKDFSLGIEYKQQFYETIYHETGWRLIIQIKQDVMTDYYYFNFYYGDKTLGFHATQEFVESSNWPIIVEQTIDKIRKETDMAKDVEIIVEVDNDVNGQIKEWAKQFEQLKEVAELAGDPPTKFGKNGIPGKPDNFKYESFPQPELRLSSLATHLPGVKEIVKYPCDCYSQTPVKHDLMEVIMHLNDADKWTRESIADWLDTLEIDLSFKPLEKENNE